MPAPKRGFTLVELAVALFIIGIMLAATLPLMTPLETRKMDETRFMLEQAREALVAYAAQYGYFPCPADAASGGLEPAAGVDHTTGNCPSYFGFLPARLLGFTPMSPDGYAVDPWGSQTNRLRYAVSNASIGGVARALTLSRGMAAAGSAALGSATTVFIVCNSGSGVTPGTDCGTSQTLVTNAAIVIWSVGPNGGTGGGTSVHEAENPNPNGGSTDRVFVSRARTTGAGAEFDDMLMWVPTTTIVSRMLSVGQLP